MEFLKRFSPTNCPYFPYIVGGGVAVITLVVLHKKYKKCGKRVTKVKCPPNTVLLYQFPRGTNAPSLSPFPLKLETYLRMAKIPYVTDLTAIMSSKGKIPWMSYNGVEVADSQFCIEYLNSELQIDLNKHLTTVEKAVARTFQVMVEEHLYWCGVFFRYVQSGETSVTTEVFKLSPLMVKFMKKKMKGMLHAQGVGRHTAKEIEHKLHLDLQAVSDYLGEKPYLFGDVPCQEDCAVFGMMAQFVYHERDPVTSNLVQEKYPNIYRYVLRMKEKFWPDWDEVSKMM